MKILRTVLDVGFVTIFIWIVTVKVYCRITGKFRGFVQRDCNKSVKLNHEIPIVFHNLRNLEPYYVITRQIHTN